MKGSDIEAYLDALPHARQLNRDNNDYLVSYRLDTDAEVAFDPRTGDKASLFIALLPSRLLNTPGVSLVEKYPPKNPSTALKRVSPYLDGLSTKYRVRVQNQVDLERLVEWVRWA